MLYVCVRSRIVSLMVSSEYFSLSSRLVKEEDEGGVKNTILS